MLGTGVAALAAVVTVFGQAGSPTIGTWKLNLAKSKYDPANLAPKSMTTKMEAVGGSIKSTTIGTDFRDRRRDKPAMPTNESRVVAMTAFVKICF